MEKAFLRALADSYNSIQKVRISLGNRLFAMTQGMDEKESIRFKVFDNVFETLKKIEKDLLKIGDKELEAMPVYTEFLSKIKGLGPTLSLKLLSFHWDLNKPLSSWNAYAGLIPHVWKAQCPKGHRVLLPADPKIKPQRCYVKINELLEPCNEIITEGEIAPCKRHSGYQSFWNTKLKTTMYLIATSFAKTGKFYKNVYQKAKEKYLSENISPAHATMRALRKTAKLFLAHFYQAWHELEGLPYRLPYQFEYLNHQEFIPWQEVIDYELGIQKKRVKLVVKTNRE